MLRPLRVLVVDDNEDMAALFADSLALEACEARPACNAASALAVARDFAPDVALLDIGLPDMDGYELGSRLRALPGLAQLKLIAVTGYSGDAEKRTAERAGFDAHLVKPVELRSLFSAISEVVKRRGASSLERR